MLESRSLACVGCGLKGEAFLHPLSDALSRLEHLKALLDRYNPIKYTSGDETHSLAQEIPQAYGAVEDVYKQFAGAQRVELVDGKQKHVFSNYFEAGYLSGSTLQAHEGYQELLRVIGRVRAIVLRKSMTDPLVRREAPARVQLCPFMQMAM
jgi:hypothetical protein